MPSSDDDDCENLSARLQTKFISNEECSYSKSDLVNIQYEIVDNDKVENK